MLHTYNIGNNGVNLTCVFWWHLTPCHQKTQIETIFFISSAIIFVLTGLIAFTIQNIGAIGRGNGSCIYFKIYNYG